MTDSNEDAPPPADVVVKLEEAEDDMVSPLTQALAAGKLFSKKAKVSHICEAVDRDKYIEALRRNIHILKVEWDWPAKFGHTRQVDNDNLHDGWSHYRPIPCGNPLDHCLDG